MPSRLGSALLSYFSRHIERGDWHACLKSLRGCMEAGTLNHHLPCVSLFPFLLAHGQWESALRVAGDVVASLQGLARKADKNECGDEKEFYNSILRSLSVPDVARSKGCWRMAMAIVQYAAERRVQLEEEVVRNALSRVILWEEAGDISSGNGRSSSSKGTAAAAVSSEIQTAPHAREIERREALQRMHETLLQQGHFGESQYLSTRIGSDVTSGGATVLQLDLIRALSAVLEESLKTEASAAASHWLRFREQMMTSFGSSWEGTVHTLLRVCAPSHLLPMTVDVDAEKTAPWGGGVIDNMVLQPDVADRVLGVALDCMFDSSVIPPPTSGAGAAVACCECTLGSLEWWRSHLASEVAHSRERELQKWKAVVLLAMCKLEKREQWWETLSDFSALNDKEQHAITNRPGSEVAMDIKLLKRLCVSSQLVLLHGKLNDEEIKNVLRKLLFHGSSALSVHGKVGELVETIQLLVSTIQVLMAAGSRSSRMPHPESATMLNSALDTPAPVEFPCEMSGQHISSCRGAGSHLVKKQCLSSSRAVYWDSVLFPTSWEISCSTLQGSVNTTGTPGRLSWEGAWQLLLQRVFEDNSMISMWFSDEDYGVFSAEGDNGSPECVESLPLRAQQSASPTTDIHSVKSSGHQRSASYSSRGHRVILHGDAFRHLVKLLHFLGRRHDTEERKFPLDFNGCGNPHFSSLCSPNRGPDRFNHEQIKHAEVWTPNSGTGVSTPLLSQVVRHQQDANRLGEALLSLHINSVEGNVVNSVSDVGRMLRTLAASVPRKFIKPLLGHMINFVSRPLSKVRADTATASPWWTCYVALVAFMHKSRTCTSSQKSGHSAALLNLMEPRTFAWWPALVLFSEATVPICQQQWEKEGLKWSTRTQGKGNGSSTTISHIMDAMLVKASTPRWREALQVEAMFRALQPFDHNHHLRAQQNTKRIPLDESERIDLYEAAIQLRRRNQWAVAAALLTAHASRRLSGQDVAPFSFVLAHVPLCFIQSVLLILVRERERNCDVAKAALAACVRSARQSHREMFVSVESRQLTMNNCPTVDAVDREIANCAVTAQDLREQERVFFQHEVLDAMSLALQVWPTPITRDEDYVLIWRYLRYGCGGDARMARLLLRRSSLLDSPYAKAEVESLAHTVSLCHSAQDGSSAAAAYAAFLMKRRGLQLPTKTLLMLLDLCTLAVDDSVGQDEGSKTELHGHRDASLLHALLEEALMASHLTGDSETVSFNSKNESIFVHVCRIIFRLRGSTYSCKGVPWLHSDVGPGVKRHILRFLHLVVRHLEDSDAVFLANLPFFVGVLRSLPLTVMKAAETEMGRGGVGSKSNEDQSFTQLSVLTARMLLRAERMERQLNTFVIFDCIFWLYVMKYTALTEYVFPCRDGNVWNGQRVGSPCLDALHAQVSSGLNERTNAEALLHATVLKASNHVRDRMVERTHQEAEAMGRVIHSCFVEAVLYVFEQCRIVPLPSSLLLTGVALALGGKSEVHTLWPICGSDVCFYPIPLHTLALIQMLIASLNTRWVLEELAVTTCSNDTLMITTNETATFTARVTVSYVKDLVGLLSSLTASCLRSMNEADEERDVLKEVAGNCDVKCELSCISRLIASVAGMCMAVQKTLPLGACMDELQRLCESLRRALHRNEGKTCGIAMLPNHTSFLLRVVSTVLSGTEDQSSDNLVERLLANFSSGASASDTGLFADNHTDLALAMALLQVSLCGAPLVDSFLCTLIPTLLSDVASNAPLKEKTARIIGLALCYLASFGSTSAVRCFLAVIPLSAATQLLTCVGEGLPLVGLLAFHDDLGHESRPPPRFLLPDNTLVSLIVFGELAAMRHARWGAAVHMEADVTAMMDVISNIVPHRWDMAVAIAVGFPLLLSAGSEYEVSAAGTVLGNRLAHALQSFGSWPPGRMLEAVVGTCFISVSPTDTPHCCTPCSGILPDCDELLEVATGINIKLMHCGLPQAVGSPNVIPSLALLVQRQHRRALVCASIILGNAGSARKEGSKQAALEALRTASAAVQLLAVELMRTSSYNFATSRGTVKVQRNSSSIRGTSLSDLQMPCVNGACLWSSLGNEARQLLLWNRLTFMPIGLDVMEVDREERLLAMAKKMLSLPPSHELAARWDWHGLFRGDFLMNFPLSLFNASWVAELCRKWSVTHSDKVPCSVRVALRLPGSGVAHQADGSDVIATSKGSLETARRYEGRSLLHKPSGFSSLQYVYALEIAGKEERLFLLLLACCCRTVEEMEQTLLNQFERSCSLSLESVVAAWNVVCIRRLELGSSVGDSACAELPITQKVAVLFISLLTVAGKGNDQLLHTRKQLVSEIIAHSLDPNIYTHEHREVSVDDAALHKTCKNVALAAVDFLNVRHGLHLDANNFDDEVNVSLQLLRNPSLWQLSWEPFPLELLRCQRFVKEMQHGKVGHKAGGLVGVCPIRHPATVAWVLRHYASDLSGQPVRTVAGDNTPGMAVLFHLLQRYVESGVVTLSVGEIQSESAATEQVSRVTMKVGTVPVFVRGMGAGLAVDQFVAIFVHHWSLAGRRASSAASDSLRGRDILDRVVDAIFTQPTQDSAPSSHAHLFLSGYTPITSNGLQALLRLLLYRISFDKRWLLSAENIALLRRLEQQRQCARMLAVRDIQAAFDTNANNDIFRAFNPLLAELGAPRSSFDTQLLLLFHLRALVAVIHCVSPLGWNARRQCALDMVFTALLDFLYEHEQQLLLPDVDVMTNSVEKELERIFGTDIRQVIHTALQIGARSADERTKGVTVSQLLRFITGEWGDHGRFVSEYSAKFHVRGPRRGLQRGIATDSLERQLYDALARHKAFITTLAGAQDILLLKDEESPSSVISADCAPILRVLPLVQRSLKTSATVPSHELLLDILDVASVPCAGDVEIIHCGLNVFYTVAPYAVVSTMILEKVLVLLVTLAAYRPRDPLGMNVLDLILCRFQYVALNTPAAVATMCELFGRLSCCFGTSERDSAKTDIKSFSSEDCHSLSISMTERTERLLWRCIVEAARVDCALLEEALLLVGINALSAVQRGCLHFLLRGRHKQPQYDPPFLQFGQQLDVVIMKLRHGASEHRSFVQQLASMMEAQGSVGAFVPWRRAMLFIPEVTRDSSGEHARLSLLVAILKQSLESNTSRNNVGHYLWRQALVAIGKCHESNEAVVNAVAVALRTIHTVRPHGQWKPALVLTQRLSAAAHMPSTTLPGSWWWTSAGAVGFHTMRYLVESCDVCGIPLSMLIAFLKHIERHHEKKSLLDGKVVLVDEKIPSEGRHANVLGRAKVVADFTSGLQRHPYLNWVVALDALRLLLSVERDLLSSCENSAYAAKKNQNSGSAQRILCNSRDTFIKSIVTRLYKQHAYEPLLRFVEASQHLTSSRVGGKDMISMLNRAATAVLPPIHDARGKSSGPWELIMLLNGSVVGKTLSDILEERSHAILAEKERLLRDLMRNDRCREAAALVKQAPVLLKSRVLHNSCVGLMNRFHHSTVAHFFSDLLQPDIEGAEAQPTSMATGDICNDLNDAVLHAIPFELLSLSLTAFDVTANSMCGLEARLHPVVALIIATWLRAASSLSDAIGHEQVEKLGSTMLWVKRDFTRDADGPLRTIATCLEEIIESMDVPDSGDGTAKLGGEESFKDSDSSHCVFLVSALEAERSVGRLFVETFSGSFPRVTARLCEAMRGVAHGSDKEWLSYLRCTGWYNTTLLEGWKQCEKLRSEVQGDRGDDAVIMWRDRAVSARSVDWVKSLALVGAAHAFLEGVPINGSYATRLVKLASRSNSLAVLLAVGRNIFLNYPPRSTAGTTVRAAVEKREQGPHPLTSLLDPLGSFLDEAQTMKRRLISLLSNTYCDTYALTSLESALVELRLLNEFVAGVVEKLQSEHRRTAVNAAVEEVFDGRVALASLLISCLTAVPGGTSYAEPVSIGAVHAPNSGVDSWRSLLHRILVSVPEVQRERCMFYSVIESTRDSFRILYAHRQCSLPVTARLEDMSSSLWCSALCVVTSDRQLWQHVSADGGDGSGSDKRSNPYLHSLIDTLSLCAHLTRDAGFDTMKFICDAVRRLGHTTLTEELRSLLKIACIYKMGIDDSTKWQTTYESLTGEFPFVAQRGAVFASAEEVKRQRLTEAQLAASDWNKALGVLLAQRAAGVRLGDAQYSRTFSILEAAVTEANAGALSEKLLMLHLWELQDGGVPNLQRFEKVLQTLSRPEVPPIRVLEYAKSLTLLCPVKSDRQFSDRSTTMRKPLLCVSTGAIGLITDAAHRLYTTDEQCRTEGVRMLAVFLDWLADFQRLPCIGQELMEKIVTLLSAVPLRVPVGRPEDKFDGKILCITGHASDNVNSVALDVRTLLGLVCACHFSDTTGPGNTKITIQGDEALMPRVCHFSDSLAAANGAATDYDGRWGVILTHESMTHLRETATAALRFVERQMCIHSSLCLSTPLLCSAFGAAVAGVTPTSDLLRFLGRIAGNTELVKPALRYVLALTVAEQSVLWQFLLPPRSFEDDKEKSKKVNKLPITLVRRSIEQLYDRVRVQFAPEEACAFRGLLAPGSSYVSHEGECGTEDVIEENRSLEDFTNSPTSNQTCTPLPDGADQFVFAEGMPQTCAWRQSLKLFHVLARNARPTADLSLPFAALIELLSKSGKLSAACSYITHIGAPTLSAEVAVVKTVPSVGDGKGADQMESETDMLRFASKHIVFDGFALKKIVDATGTMHSGKGQLFSFMEHNTGAPKEFWLPALRILEQHQVLVRQTLTPDRCGAFICESDLMPSLSLFALIKEISSRKQR